MTIKVEDEDKVSLESFKFGIKERRLFEKYYRERQSNCKAAPQRADKDLVLNKEGLYKFTTVRDDFNHFCRVRNFLLKNEFN